MSDYRALFFDKQDQMLVITKKAMELQERVTELENALKRIASYQSPEQLLVNAEESYNLSYEEALEAAYENVLQEARAVILPKDQS